MKVKVLITAFMIAGIAPAQAADEGAWVKVDANGNAVGQAIVCTPDVCGDSASEYAKATLGAGERYVLQTNADPITKNVAGFGNNNPGVAVKVDIPTNTWTVSTIFVQKLPADPVTQETIKVITKTTQTFNPYTQPVPVVETVTKAESKVIVDWTDPDFDWDAWWENWILAWQFFSDWWSGL